MYGMVLMVAVAGSGDTASFGGRNNCNGSSCDGGGHIFGKRDAGCCGGGGHIFGKRDAGACCGGGGHFFGKRHSCDGGGCTGSSCTGYSAGCTGTVVAPAAPVVVAPAAPVVAAPCAPACDPCAAPACDPCAKKKREGLFARLCKKKKADCDTCATPAPACTTCGAAPVVVPPVTGTTPPATMPPVTGKS